MSDSRHGAGVLDIVSTIGTLGSEWIPTEILVPRLMSRFGITATEVESSLQEAVKSGSILWREYAGYYAVKR